MKLSIIVPVYRVAATLNRCMESIVKQTFDDFEVILVDDGSPDDCPKRCDDWADKDGRVRVIHKPNGGLSDARNAGIEAARGELITFVDSDDFLATDTYAQVVPLLETADIAEFPLFRHYGSNRKTFVGFLDEHFDDMADYWLRGRAYEHTYAWNKVYRRQLFDHVRFPKGRIFEDAWTLPLLLKQTRRVVTCAKGCYYYTANPQGITAQADGNALSSLLDAHLTAMNADDRLARDVRYYMHVLNIQMDVWELTGCPPQLPDRRFADIPRDLTRTLKLKYLMLRLLGMERLCKTNARIHKLTGRRS